MPPDPIVVTYADVESHWTQGRRSIYRYRRLRVASIDAWGSCFYSPMLDASRDVRVWVARILELKLTGLYEGQAKIWIEENSPIWIPTSEDNESIRTLDNPRPAR